jgi:glycosyltransferase involved in cell wall biosynthesis
LWHLHVAEPLASDAGARCHPHERRRAIELIAFVPYPPDTTPSQRFRIEQWSPALEQVGIRVSLAPFADARLMSLLYQPGRTAQKIAGVIGGFTRQLGRVASAGRGDAILIHRTASLAGPALLERILTLWRKPVLFDFDDAIYLRHTSGANRVFDWLKLPGKTAALCRLSSLVVAGSDYLAMYARRHNPRVVVVPTSVDTDLYVPTEPEEPSGRVTIGWTGSATSLTYLEEFVPVLRELQRRRDVEVRVQSNRRPELPGVRAVWQPWSPATEIQEIRRYHIGIKPMPDDPWARGKCPMKELQYMALGVPAVCSAAGSSVEAIRDGENGFLAASADQWLEHLTRLVDDAALRRKIGLAGRQTVEERYSMRKCASRFAEALMSVVAAKGIPEKEKTG